MKKLNLIGQTFGRLTAVNYDVSKGTRHTYFICTCTCGNTSSVRGSHLTSGNVKSCGCLTKDTASLLNRKHGMRHTSINMKWRQMKQRCDDSKTMSYKYYGARGITYDDKWKTFEGFHEDMGDSYFEGASLERINVNSNYTKDNCCWIESNKQGENRRNTLYVEYNGERVALVKLLKQLNLMSEQASITQRIKKGWDVNKALFTPVRKCRRS